MEHTKIYWLHGSPKRFEVLKRRKAQAPPMRPSQESLNAIYLTPDIGFALACAIGSKENRIEVNHFQKTIRFENPHEVDPEKVIYIYFVDPSNIPDERKVWIDQWQIAINMDEIIPVKAESYKASEISKYYRILNNCNFNKKNNGLYF